VTYCLGLNLHEGIVLLSDTRTNAGVDNVSRFRKTFTWEIPGERAIALVTAGNLSITQGVVTRIDRALQNAASQQPADGEAPLETILNAESMYRVAQIVGDHMREMQERHRNTLESQGAAADASIIVAGQRKGGKPRMFLVYSAGNFIESNGDTPFFQIGDHKYGKPILDRVIDRSTPINEALKAAYVSMDSTIRSNLAVGMPLDLTIIRADEFTFAARRRIEADDAVFLDVSAKWSEALRQAYHALPEIPY